LDSCSEPAGNYAEIGRLSRPFRAFVPVTLALFASLGVILASIWLVLAEKRNEAA
jgi:hypothetical protein